MSLAETVFKALQRHNMKLATAESCTGGMVAAAITDIAGSSIVFDRGFVTYSNSAKTEMLGVPADLISSIGAVSREVAIAMARGALDNSNADIAVAVTGVAGPTGGSPDKPVGLVHFAVAQQGKASFHNVQKFGNLCRRDIRTKSMNHALSLILAQLEAEPSQLEVEP
jgi:nicotinamide-nucleotide amidase